MKRDQAFNLADKLETREIRLGNDLSMIMDRKAVKCVTCGEIRFFNSAEGLRCIAYLHEDHIMEVTQMTLTIKATFYTILGQVYKTGTYSTMKRARSARERYELQYGACLRMVTQEVTQ